VGTAITDNPDEHRYEIHLDAELAGYVDYRRHPGVVELIHTEIDPRFEHRGLANQLIVSVLDRARADGLQVIPICPYVRAYITGHPDYLDLVPPGRRAEFGLPVE